MRNHLEMTQLVLDGGSLLQRIPWSKGTTFSTICNHYVNYVTGKYYDAVVVFYAYRSGPTTKYTAHLRRTKGITGAKVYLTQNTPFKTEKEQFLSNPDNKLDFIFALSRCLEENELNTINAKGDADVIIVKRAVKCAENREVALIGGDRYASAVVLSCQPREQQDIFQIRAQSKIIVKRPKNVGYKENQSIAWTRRLSFATIHPCFNWL